MTLDSGCNRYAVLSFQVTALMVLCSREETPDLLVRIHGSYPLAPNMSKGPLKLTVCACAPAPWAPVPIRACSLCAGASCCSTPAPRDIRGAHLPAECGDEVLPFLFTPVGLEHQSQPLRARNLV